MFLPFFSAVIITLFFCSTVAKRSRILPVGELGVSYVLAIFLYTVFPLGIFLLLQGQYTPLNDFRLFMNQPPAEEIGAIGWMYVGYLFCFAVSYLYFRGKRPNFIAPMRRSDGLQILWAFGVILLFNSALLVANTAFGVEDSGYSDAYTKYAKLPLILSQALPIFENSIPAIQLILFSFLISNYKKYRYLIPVFIVAFAAPVVLQLGRRGALVVMFLGVFFLYHWFVKPVRLIPALLGSTSLLALFIVLGIARQINTSGNEDYRTIASNNEFEACFATVYEVKKAEEEGTLEPAPPAVLLADFIGIFPQQVVPFEKQDPNYWYLEQFYPGIKESGQAWGFGVLSEALIGFGWPEIILKGLLIGYVFARLHRWFCRRSWDWRVVMIYIYINTTCFRTFRSSSFELLRSSIYIFIPAILLTQLYFFLRSRKRAPKRRRPVPATEGAAL